MFKDVDKNKWYAKDVEEAAKLGLIMGTGKDKFEPEKTLTRAELAAVAVRLYKATNEDFVEVIESVLPSVVQIKNNLTGSLRDLHSSRRIYTYQCPCCYQSKKR